MNSCSILNFSDEVTTQIFSHLGVDGLGKVSQTCKQWYKISKDNSLWKSFAIARLGDQAQPAPEESWKEMMRRHSFSTCLENLKNPLFGPKYFTLQNRGGDYYDYALQGNRLLHCQANDIKLWNLNTGVRSQCFRVEGRTTGWSMHDGPWMVGDRAVGVHQERVKIFSCSSGEQLNQTDEDTDILAADLCERYVAQLYPNQVKLIDIESPEEITCYPIQREDERTLRGKIYLTRKHIIAIYHEDELVILNRKNGTPVYSQKGVMHKWCHNEEMFYYVLSKKIFGINLNDGVKTKIGQFEPKESYSGHRHCTMWVVCSKNTLAAEHLHSVYLFDLKSGEQKRLDVPIKPNNGTLVEGHLIVNDSRKILLYDLKGMYLVRVLHSRDPTSSHYPCFRVKFHAGKLISGSKSIMGVWDLSGTT